MEEVEVKRKEELQITEDNRNYYADVTFTSKKTAYDYLSLMARKGINVAEDCLSLAYGYSVMVDNAIEYVKRKSMAIIFLLKVERHGYRYGKRNRKLYKQTGGL